VRWRLIAAALSHSFRAREYGGEDEDDWFDPIEQLADAIHDALQFYGDEHTRAVEHVLKVTSGLPSDSRGWPFVHGYEAVQWSPEMAKHAVPWDGLIIDSVRIEPLSSDDVANFERQHPTSVGRIKLRVHATRWVHVRTEYLDQHPEWRSRHDGAVKKVTSVHQDIFPDDFETEDDLDPDAISEIANGLFVSFLLTAYAKMSEG
jgi:hypothetical protein